MAQYSPQATIIIPVHNQIGYLKSCIRSIYKAENKATFEILVVDDCSTPQSASELNALDGFRLIRNYKNLGFLRTCNRASLNAKGKYLFFLNSDTEVTDYWLDELLSIYDRFPEAGLIGSKLVYPDGTLQECGGIVWKDGSAWNYGRNLDPTLPEFNYTKEVDYVSGASILIEKSLFIELGMFDCRYTPAYYEDTDLAFKVRQAGKKVYLEPKSVVIHHEGKSNGVDLQSGIKSYQRRNSRKFYLKWNETLYKEHNPNGEGILKARDRSLRKKKILVIDHYVPRFDRDAGSRCIYMCLQLMVEMELSVTFFTDNFFQDPLYTPTIEKLGIEVLYGVYYRDNHKEWLKENSKHFDYVFLSRPHIAYKHIDTIRKYSNAKTLFFGHDIHHLRLEREAATTGIDLSEAIKKNLKFEEYLWNNTDYLLYPSDEEVEYIQNRIGNANTVEFPIFLFNEESIMQHRTYEDSSGFLFVGNYSHTPNIDALEWFISEIYPIIQERLDVAPLRIVGSGMPNSVSNLKSDSITVLQNVNDSELINLYRNSRISVVPLRYGAGVKGKTLESLYYGTPLVTTKIGAQGIPGIKDCSFVTDDPKEFAYHCCNLYNSANDWNRCSSNSRKVLLKKYSTRNARTILESILNND